MSTHDERNGWDVADAAREQRKDDYAEIAHTERITTRAMGAVYEWAYFTDQGETHTVGGEKLPTVVQLVDASDAIHALNLALWHARQATSLRWYV